MSLESDVSVDVAIAEDTSDIPEVAAIQRCVTEAVRASRQSENQPVEVSVRIVGRDESRALNRDYRHRDNATNVLSFPAGEIEGLPADARRALGDIVVCAPVIAHEAVQQRKAPHAHWAHMIVHGTLHLLGYEHDDDREASEMEALEVAILAELGFADPYIVQTDTIG